VNVLNGKLARLRFDSLTFTAASVARVDSRIGGGGSLNYAVILEGAHAASKIRAQFQEHKHT
jgi:hypothetical protein